MIGYFTLNSFAFPKEQGRRRDRDRHLGAYNPVPAILIGRLAPDESFQGQGLGSVLIFEALYRSLALSAQIGAAVVVVHASDANVARFSEHQGCTRFRDEPLHLYYPLKTFARAVPPSPGIEGAGRRLSLMACAYAGHDDPPSSESMLLPEAGQHH